MSPNPKAKVYLQTPNWPYSLPPYVSISWFIVVPSKQTARLGFSKDRMGIACETGRAYVNIKEEALGAEETVRREDELLPQPRNMHHNFWVNVSNCKPVDKTHLTLQFWVTFADKQIGESCKVMAVCFLLVPLLSLGVTVVDGGPPWMWALCEIPAFENVCPSKTPESFSWVLVGAGDEGAVLMWYSFLGSARCVSGFSFINTSSCRDQG